MHVFIPWHYFIQPIDSADEDTRAANRRQLSHVASRVQSEYSFLRAVEGPVSNPTDLEASNEYVKVYNVISPDQTR